MQFNHNIHEVIMRAYAGIFILISLLFLVGTVGAVMPDKITFTSTPEWVVANGVYQSTIIVRITNQSMPLSSSTVIFTVTDSSLGSMNPISVTTNSNGEATRNFNVKTKSGNATITVAVTNGTDTNTFTIYQNIDHDTPYYDLSISPPLFTYSGQGSVASQVPFKVSIYDKWGNPIDNRNPLYTHNIGLHVSSALLPDDCNFVGYGQDISLPLDLNGTLSVNVKLTTKSGTNKILMDNFEGKISSQIAWITVMAADMPYSMTESIFPGNTLPANNIDKFLIEYYLYDKYANPIGNRSIWISTNVSGETTPTEHISDPNGLIRFYYGPKISILAANITAIAKDNVSVTNNLIANFVSSPPTNMVIAITPQTMASREIKPTEQAFVRATVFDNWGNPAQGEQVNFSLGTASHGTYNLTAEPQLSSSTATTDKDGNAIVLFYPGSFANRTDPSYSGSSTGSVVITATWNTISNPVTAVWKNYPYLSIDSSVVPPNIKVNETIDITINVTGNGYAMGGKPVTVILDEDCTSNMFSNKDEPPVGAKRIDSAKAAAKVFVDQMKEGQDYIGFNSFGTEKNDQFDLPPQPSMSLVKSRIDSLVKGTNGQEFVPSIYESINNITATQPFRPQDEVRAVIILHDAGASSVSVAEENAIVSAALSPNPKIYLFTVLYYDGGSTSSSTEVTMRALANRTGAKFFKPTTPDELKQAYIDIAGILRTLAGVNATMNLDFKNIEVNGTQMSGDKVFSYVPVEMGMTNPGSRTTILWQNKTRSFLNQSDEWNANQQLRFNIGTINISETWSTTYRLRANQTGLINIFNCSLSGSSLSFNNGTENMCLPNLYITVNPNTTPLGLQSGLLSVTNIFPDSGNYNYTDKVPISWYLNYTGFDTGIETYYYCHKIICNELDFKVFDYGLPFSDTQALGGEILRNTVLDVKDFPPGYYQIKVRATVPGIQPDEVIGAFTKPPKNPSVSIWLN